MKKTILTSLLLIQFLFSAAQEKIEIKTRSSSPEASFEQLVGSTNIKLSYSRPLARNRKIFGGLVPFDKIWRTGASDCTVITTDEDISFGEKTLKAGSYSLFTIPSKNEWIIIINTDIKLHGESGYDVKKDVLRITVPAEKTANFYETFTIDVNDINSKGEAFFKIIWENTLVKIPIKSKEDATILALIDKNIVLQKSNDANLLFQAANYYYTTNRDFKQAITWLLEAEKLDSTNFYYPNLRQILNVEIKDYPNAIEAAKKAISVANKEKMKKTIDDLKIKISEWELLIKK